MFQNGQVWNRFSGKCRDNGNALGAKSIKRIGLGILVLGKWLGHD